MVYNQFACTYCFCFWFCSLWQTSMASPFAAQQQQMAALLAQQQSMIMAAAAAQNMQAGAFRQGQNVSSSNEKSAVGGVQGSAFGQQWPAADLQALGSLVSKAGVQNGGPSFSQVQFTIALCLWAWNYLDENSCFVDYRFPYVMADSLCFIFVIATKNFRFSPCACTLRISIVIKGLYSDCLIPRMCSQLGMEYDHLNLVQWAWDQ